MIGSTGRDPWRHRGKCPQTGHNFQWYYGAGSLVHQEGRCNQDQHLGSFLSGPGIIRELFQVFQKNLMTMEVFLGLPVEPAVKLE